MSMASYLSSVAADYTATELSVAPQKILVEDGQKNQIIHEFDDGSINVVALSDIFFNVTLQWTYITESEKDIIIDMYYNSAKADGSANTFYWPHPRETKTYVVRFITNPVVQIESSKPLGFVIPEVKIRVEGVKA